MNKLYSLTLLLISVTMFSCEEDSPDLPSEIDSSFGLNLVNPQPSDKTSYALYSGQCSDAYGFTGDTLVVEVITKNDSLFLKESYTAGSTRDITAEHVIIPRDGYVLIPHRFKSEFLFFYGNDTIFLERDPATQLVQSGCQLMQDGSPFIGDAIGSVAEFSYGPMRVTNKKGVSCVPGSFQLDAYIFYEDHLNAVHIVQSGLSDSIVGFIALE